jgi:hypothetical protein
LLRHGEICMRTYYGSGEIIVMRRLVNQGQQMCYLAFFQLIIGIISLFITIDFKSYIPHLAYVSIHNQFIFLHK